MKAERVELRLIYMPLVHPFETSFGVQESRRVLLVAVHSEGLCGWGECVAGDDPYYSYETPETAWHILRDYLAPMLLEGLVSGDPRAYPRESGIVRGHHMAHAALEAALWDLEAQRRGAPLQRLFGGGRTSLETGVSIGIQPDIGALVHRVRSFADRGYRRIKIKIKPGWDVEPVAAIRRALPDVPLMVDANCAYRPADADRLRELDAYNLMMIEQPLAHDDLVDHAALQRRLKTPICLDESIVSLGAARAALAMEACRVVNIKQGRVGGPGRAIEIHDLCRDAGISVWCGGMLETGIGRALNIALATLDNFSLPGDISASARYWEHDIIDPPVEVDADGTIAVRQSPGRGYEVRTDLVAAFTQELIQLFP